MISLTFSPDKIRAVWAEFGTTPMKWLTVRRLGLADIPSAFPLVHLFHKELTVEQWSDYAREVLDDSTGGNAQGFLAAYDGQGTMHGILQYEKSLDPDGQIRMTVTTILACGLFHRHKVRVTMALRHALSNLAQECGCDRGNQGAALFVAQGRFRQSGFHE